MKKLTLYIAILAPLVTQQAIATEIESGYQYRSEDKTTKGGLFIKGSQTIGPHSQIHGTISLHPKGHLAYSFSARLKADLATELALINIGGVNGYVEPVILGQSNLFGYQLKTGVEAEMFVPGLHVDTGFSYKNLHGYVSSGIYVSQMFDFKKNLSAGIEIDYEKDLGVTLKAKYKL